MKSMPQSQKGIVLVPIIIGSVIVLLIGIIAATASNPQSQKALQKGYEEGQKATKNQSGQESTKQGSETTDQKSNISPPTTPSPNTPIPTPTLKSTPPASTPTLKPSVTSTPTQDSSGGFTCSGKTTCSQMVSCAEANFYLNSCGLKSLDRDKDGVPCQTTLCK